MLMSPDGTGKVTVHKTASAPGAADNVIRRMGHYGFRWRDC
jgi:hypothetical protein